MRTTARSRQEVETMTDSTNAPRTTQDVLRALERIRAYCWANRDAWALTEAIERLRRMDEQEVQK